MTEKPTEYKTVFLCRKTTCCPKLLVENDTVIITDDYGGRVQLTHEETEILIEAYQRLKPNDSTSQ